MENTPYPMFHIDFRLEKCIVMLSDKYLLCYQSMKTLGMKQTDQMTNLETELKCNRQHNMIV